MDEPSSLRQRLRSTLFYLGASLLLAESSRALLAWLESRLWPRKAGTELALSTGPASVAFLVDGENISSTTQERLLERALDEAKKLGEVSIRRVYGSCNLFNGRWNETSLRFELEQIHLIRPTPTKNTADIALAVNAIELAKDGVCNRFCIITSDSDFTPLVRRLRELKCQVLGIGERKTPGTLVKACNWFIFADQLVESASSSLPAHTPPAPRKQTPTRTSPSQTPASPPHEPPNSNQAAPSVSLQQPVSAPAAQEMEQFPSPVIAILRQAYLDAAHERPGEWVLLSRLGLSLRRLYPDFKASDYAPDLSALIRQFHNVFEFGKRANGHPQMRLKQ
jgi:predicted nuclease of predicted toxin-antitoxin system